MEVPNSSGYSEGGVDSARHSLEVACSAHILSSLGALTIYCFDGIIDDFYFFSWLPKRTDKAIFFIIPL